VRVFDAESGEELACDYLHTRSVKKVHWDHEGGFVCSGSYDRSVIVRSANDYQSLALPLRFSNLGISGLASSDGRLFASSFDGTLICWDVATGKSAWWRYYAENTDG
jgi:WD40 repeat protein